ncbi:hypothetical protein SKDZ_02G2710 [Saccharomyces kudriavzevii ZP591]|uniref:Stress-associated endoplasmic reticulum protein n=2 Tax=Saccharomyces kudriavzevii (strain ATCC MYA-4449 / AS 2.2408 / CBS 8840 / NBRC 1802 / NCYC 2889) TaxID=226230 RepID=J4TV81_SACK1|nr:uncharacterized protein SKDI_02G2730 [Saccharomyces kudriavzevii IFO 1802]EJT42180.1 YSY6-like protein [Saccharomyces kudriavzevii IFO 1802]CAI4055648.1 hypothetical protein SKDZ_02G2710 [Saccharomyces kudriavzevii ZP591]CAI4055721.1 hypothetical protein SKDI_02G2730 [Saccharomyces kudriavzevii IFO 1802]
MAVQTPRQRLANARFNKNNEKYRKYGKKKVDKADKKAAPMISRTWLGILIFLLVGGGVLQLISYIL